MVSRVQGVGRWAVIGLCAGAACAPPTADVEGVDDPGSERSGESGGRPGGGGRSGGSGSSSGSGGGQAGADGSWCTPWFGSVRLGSTRTYRTAISGSAVTSDLTMEIVEASSATGEIQLATTGSAGSAGTVLGAGWYRCTADGVAQRRWRVVVDTFEIDAEMDPPLLLLAAELEVGTTWTLSTEVVDDETGESFPVDTEAEVVAFETVDVVAGRFEAMKVQFDVTTFDPLSWSRLSIPGIGTSWYAEGVGWVRYELETPDLSVSTELVAVAP